LDSWIRSGFVLEQSLTPPGAEPWRGFLTVRAESREDVRTRLSSLASLEQLEFEMRQIEPYFRQFQKSGASAQAHETQTTASLAGSQLQPSVIEHSDPLAIHSDNAGLSQLSQSSCHGLAVDAQLPGDLSMSQVFDTVSIGAVEDQTGNPRQQMAKRCGLKIK